MTLQDSLAAYIRDRMARALRRHLAFAVVTPANDNLPEFAA